MGLFDGFSECASVEKLLHINGYTKGEKVYFSNLIYTDEVGKEFEILYIRQNNHSAYTGVVAFINDNEVRLYNQPLPIITLVYLRMQKLSIEFNEEI